MSERLPREVRPQPAPVRAEGDVRLDLVDAVEVSDRLRLLSTPPAQGSTPPLPHEWPADPRDPLVCVHGCGNTPADVFPEEECWRRLRAAYDESRRQWSIERDRITEAKRALGDAHDWPDLAEGVRRIVGDLDRLRAAARAVVAAWDRPNAMPAFGAAIAGLRAALAGRGEG